jgi:PPOX class probable F420-dependent enzyme
MTDIIPAELIPADLADLLDRPLFGALGTVRPDGAVQVNPMWFQYDGEHIRFTHTTKRAKYRNLQQNPSMSLLVIDPDDPMRYLEVRGRLVEFVPDPTGAFYVVLGKRYGEPDQQPPADSPDRVIIVMSVGRASRH